MCMCLDQGQTLPTSSLNVLGKDICIYSVLWGLFGGQAGQLVTNFVLSMLNKLLEGLTKSKTTDYGMVLSQFPVCVVLAGILGTKTYP